MNEKRFADAIKRKDEEITVLKRKLQESENEKQRLKSGKTFVKAKVKFNAKWVTPMGEKKHATVVLTIPKVRLENDRGIVATECLVRLANGGVLTEEELTFNPGLRGFSQTDAAKLISRWTQMRVGFIEVVSSDQ